MIAYDHMPLWNNDIPSVDGKHTVHLEKGEWHDHARNRTILWKLYRPDNLTSGQTYPLVVWSHGLGGTRDGAGFLGRHMASHGYMHLHIQHDGTDDALWRHSPLHPWDAIRNAMPLDWSVIRNRYLDVPFVFNQLMDQTMWPIDTGRIGLCGHSFGALTTQVAAGMVARGEHFVEPRMVAGILYSPVPAKGADASIYDPICKTLLHITGTRDESPLESSGYKERQTVFESIHRAPQHMMVMDGADHMVFNGSRGQLESYDGIELHQILIKTISLAWWDVHIRQDQNAANWLHDHASVWMGAFGSYGYKI